MNKDQKLLEECYQQICESAKEPLYFGPPERKKNYLHWLSVTYHEVHEDGSVSINGDVRFMDKDINASNLVGKTLNKIPFKFRKVTGDFICYNCELISLEGAPREVGGDFGCSYNKFTTLKGAPEKVGGDFYCFNNIKKYQLTSLEGAPEFIGGEFASNTISDEDYRTFAKNRKYVEGKLDKELDVDLGDFS